jgi:hypothetical protein
MNDSRSLDDVVCTAKILFSCQVCAFISSRDRDEVIIFSL